MEYKNEHQRQIAILEAAMPYVAPDNRYALQLILQADTLVNLARHGGENDLEAAEAGTGAAPFQPNPQEMLQNIQKFLTPREADVVQTLLNFMNAHKLFQNYTDFVREKSGESSDTPELSAASCQNQSGPLQILFQLINGLGSLGRGLGASSGNTSQNNLLQDFLVSQLNPEQKMTFEQLRNIMYNE